MHRAFDAARHRTRTAPSRFALGILSLTLAAGAAIPAVAADTIATYDLLGRAEREYRLDTGLEFLLRRHAKDLGASATAPRTPAAPAVRPAPETKPPDAQPSDAQQPDTSSTARADRPAPLAAGQTPPTPTATPPASDGYAGITPSPVRDVPQVTAPTDAIGSKGEVSAFPRAVAPETRRTSEATQSAPRITDHRLPAAQCRELLTRAQIGDLSKAEIQLLRSSCH